MMCRSIPLVADEISWVLRFVSKTRTEFGGGPRVGHQICAALEPQLCCGLAIVIETKVVTSADRLKLDMAPGGGAAIRFRLLDKGAR